MINYAVLASYQDKELEALLKNLLIFNNVNPANIVIVVDTDNTNDKVRSIIKKYCIKSYDNPLVKDFAQQRNFLKSKCIQPYIFFLDCDEIPNYLLIKNLPNILKDNPTIDIFGVPRLNYLDHDIDMDAIPESVSPPEDQLSRVVWPDFQFRILANKPEIHFVNKVHEIPTGGTVGELEPVVSNSIVHIKTLSGQMKRQEFYEHISGNT